MVPDSLSVTNLVEQQQRCTLIHVVCMPFSLVLRERERTNDARCCRRSGTNLGCKETGEAKMINLSSLDVCTLKTIVPRLLEIKPFS